MKNIKSYKEIVEILSREYNKGQVFVSLDLINSRDCNKELYIRCFCNRFFRNMKFEFKSTKKLIVYDGADYGTIYDIESIDILALMAFMQNRCTGKELIEFNCKFLELEALGRK